MSQIYVVTKQSEAFGGFGCPAAAYSDYPSALAYAQSIYSEAASLGNDSPRDMIFMLNLTAAAVPVNTTVTATAPTSLS